MALEKSTGGIKIYSEKDTNCCIQIGDYKTGFCVNVLNSHGMFVTDEFLTFKHGHKPEVSKDSNRSEFGFRLKCSSQREKCYYFLVASWITPTNQAKFLFSCALIAYSKNTIYDESIDNCSYLSTNYLELDLSLKDEQLDLSTYSSILRVMMTCFPHQIYIVHQDITLTLSNQRSGVIAALVDIKHMDATLSNHLVYTSCTAQQYSAVFSLVQSFRSHEVTRNGNLLVLESVLSDLQTPLLFRDEIHNEFESSISRSKGQLLKGTVRL